MLLPRLYEQSEYVQLAKQAGLDIFAGPRDISKEVSKTWYVPPNASRAFIATLTPNSIQGIFHGPLSNLLRCGLLH